MSMKIKCNVLTPDRMLYTGDVHFAVVQASDGEIGFLYAHAPLIAELGYGEVRLRTGEQTEYMVVEGGFVEIKDNEMVILAENAYFKSELNKDDLSKQIQELTVKLHETKEFREKLLIQFESKKVKGRLKVASR
jgi:F-type H+-transporting ATPase subunit epsilon